MEWKTLKYGNPLIAFLFILVCKQVSPRELTSLNKQNSVVYDGGLVSIGHDQMTNHTSGNNLTSRISLQNETKQNGESMD